MSRKNAIRSVIAPLMDGATSVSLLIYPNHHNIGDSLIWHATVELLNDLGISINYICNEKNYSAEKLRTQNPDQPILLCGGGNFGDLYENESFVRLNVIQDFHDRKVIQLPQTIYFKNEDGHKDIKRAIESHSDFTLLVRDKESFSRAQRLFNCKTIMCHDTAFYIEDRVSRDYGLTSIKSDRNVWILRKDGENGRAFSDTSIPHKDLVTDWPEENPATIRKWPLPMQIQRIIVSRTLDNQLRFLPNRTFIHLANKLAKNRSQLGLHLVSQGSQLHTDRLHAGIMGDMLQVNTTLIDNSYGKNRAVYDYSLKHSPHTTLQLN